MQIKFLSIKNFKSIHKLEIQDVENALILVGKNNTGKTVVLDAIRAVTGDYVVSEKAFNEKKQNIEIGMVLEITEEDLQQFQNKEELSHLRANTCTFDGAKMCNHCFSCIGLINQKKPEDLQLHEAARLLEYKMYQLNLSELAKKVNANYQKNGGMEEIRYSISCDMDKMFRMEAGAWHEEQKRFSPVDNLGNGMKSIYMLSLLETYIEDEKRIPSIIVVEYPELFLHPSLQKTASKILYRLSKKNQVIFTTHSPNMVANFTRGQICQMVLDKDGYSTIRRNADIDDILNDLGYSANDLLNVDFVFIVEGKQDKTRFPLLLEKYYADMYDKNGDLSRISIITTNSCTNIKTYANLKYMNQLYLRDQFLMIHDSDGKEK